MSTIFRCCFHLTEEVFLFTKSYFDLKETIMDDYTAYRAAVSLWKIVPPVLIILGNIGNVLVIIVLTRRRARISPTSVFLSALAVSDLLALDTGLLRQWIKYTFSVDIRTDHSVVGCRVHWFIVYVATQMSSWMLACVTLERVINTWYPHKRHRVCNMNSSIASVLLILVCLLFLNGHYLVGYGTVVLNINATIEVQKCEPLSPKYNDFILYTWTWIDLAVFYLIPMFVLSIGNSLIIYKVLDSRRKVKRSVAPTTGNGTSTGTNGTQLSNLTTSLMCVSFVFMICITSIVVFPIGQPYWEKNASNRKLADLFLIETIANLLMYVNHSTNFILYFLSGTVFRNDVKKLFLRRRATIQTVSLDIAPSGT